MKSAFVSLRSDCNCVSSSLIWLVSEVSRELFAPPVSAVVLVVGDLLVVSVVEEVPVFEDAFEETLVDPRETVVEEFEDPTAPQALRARATPPIKTTRLAGLPVLA
jgi:hypothetical protein